MTELALPTNEVVRKIRDGVTELHYTNNTDKVQVMEGGPIEGAPYHYLTVLVHDRSIMADVRRSVEGITNVDEVRYSGDEL